MLRLERAVVGLLLLVICLAVLVTGCAALEAIDKGGCRVDCKRAGLGFSRYEFKEHRCWGLTASGEEHQLY